MKSGRSWPVIMRSMQTKPVHRPAPLPGAIRRWLTARPVRRVLLPLLVISLLLAVWELGGRLTEIPDYILPLPSQIGATLAADLGSPRVWADLLVTAEETFAGFALGALLGMLLGFLIAELPVFDEAVYPIIVAFQAMPKVAVAPLLLIWLGFGIGSKVAVAALLAFFPVLVNTVLGLRSGDPQQEELMHALAAKRWQVFAMVRFYNALPSIFAGLELAMVFAVIGAIVGEFVGARAGLGYLIQQRNADTDVPGIFAVLFILGVFGALVTYGVKLLAWKVVFWRRGSDDR